MYKKIIYILFLLIFIASCGTFDSVKRGLTGQKKQSSDEFLIKKKDPLILPPDFENLPTPDEREVILEESSIFENTMEGNEDETTSGATSVESSILKKIQRK